MKLSFPDASLNPDKIRDMLFYFHDQAHFNHLQTTSFARHKALDILYTSLVDVKDSISELLLGYIAPQRFSKTNTPPVRKEVTDEQLVDSLCEFADKLYEYGEHTKWWALSNQAADLSGLAYKVRYLLTLK